MVKGKLPKTRFKLESMHMCRIITRFLCVAGVWRLYLKIADLTEPKGKIYNTNMVEWYGEMGKMLRTPVDNLIPLATISVLEDMYISITAQSASALTNIKETIESPVLESAQILPVIGTHIAHATSMVQRESSRIDEPTLVPTSLPH
ncbi:hypothetical protein YC2023_029261 [Brassica napus]